MSGTALVTTAATTATTANGTANATSRASGNATKRPSSFFMCSISGKTPVDDPVVTPRSGRICERRLLLQKLADNGGVDPFLGMPLDESDVIHVVTTTHHTGENGKEPPPPPPPPQLASCSSMSSLLQTVQSEYDAVLLELFDTRRALEETRRELSQALYQNDASIRVIARLSQERDAAREQLAAAAASAAMPPPQPKRPPSAEGDPDSMQVETEKPQPQDASHQTKRRRVEKEEENDAADSMDTGIPDKIPSMDLQVMIDTWQSLSQQRRAWHKKLKSSSLANEVPPHREFNSAPTTPSLHKSTAPPGILSLRPSAALSPLLENQPQVLFTLAHDKQAVLYSHDSGTILDTLSAMPPTALIDLRSCGGSDSGNPQTLVAVATPPEQEKDSSAQLQVYTLSSSSNKLQPLAPSPLNLPSAAVVALTIHPSAKFVLVVTRNGTVTLCSITPTETPSHSSLQLAASFSAISQQDTLISCAALHPDGLILALGGTTTSSSSPSSPQKRQVWLWDLKAQALASTLLQEEADAAGDTSAVSAILFSENGYHVVCACQATVRIWDLRKLKLVATLEDTLEVSALSMDPTGRILAVARRQQGSIDLFVLQGKEWNKMAGPQLASVETTVSQLVWISPFSLVSASAEERPLRIWNLEKKTPEEGGEEPTKPEATKDAPEVTGETEGGNAKESKEATPAKQENEAKP